jgi:DNA repair exonuclease SbcCD nuclease subunit
MNPVFVHAADLHLGSKLRKLGNPATRAELVREAEKAFDNLIQKTIDVKAEFLVLAGDIYDRADREAGAQIQFVSGLKRLVDNDIKVYIVHGNHDPLMHDLVQVVDIPDGVKVFPSGELEVVKHELRDGGHVLVAGISFATPAESENLSLRFQKVKRGDARAVIGVLHTNIGGAASGHHDYAPCKEADLRLSDVDYWALGHVHKTTITRLSETKFWAYPGNLQGRDSGEPGPKGALIVPIQNGGVGTPQHVALDMFRFAFIEVNCSGMKKLDDISNEISRQLSTSENPKKLIIRVRLTGRSEVRDVLDHTEKGTTTHSLIEKLCTMSLNGGHIEKLIDDVLPDLDLEQLAQHNDLRGDLLQFINGLDRDSLVALLGDDAPELLTDDEVAQTIELMRRDVLQTLTSSSEDGQ